MKIKTPNLAVALASILFLAACVKSNNPTSSMPPAPKVNAGPDQTITLPVDSVTLAGSAHDSVSRITGYNWSEISGPNTPVIVDDGNPTTKVTGLIAGTYIFQLMAVDSLGQTGVDTVSVLVRSGSLTDTQTVVLHTLFPGTNYSPYELMILANSSNPAGNAASPEMLAEAWTINSIDVYGRSFFKFNTSPIPAGAVIQTATLSLFSDTLPLNGNLVDANYGSTNDFWIERVAASWDASTNFNNEPALDSTGEVHVPQTTQNFQDLNVDVTTMLTTMLANGNYGFVMRLNTEQIYNSRIFCSSLYSDTTRHPYLTVTYTTTQ